MTDDTWSLAIVDDDLALPGWFFVSHGASAAEQSEWIAAVLEEVLAGPDWNGQPVDPLEARQVLESALAERAAVDAHGMFVVFPAVGGEPVRCFLNILASAGLPDWSTLGVVHPADSPYLGPGLQCSTRHTIEEEGVFIELAGVHFVFDNGEVTLMATLDENLTPMISRALPAFVQLVQSLRMQSPDGTAFQGLPPTCFGDDGSWPVEETG